MKKHIYQHIGYYNQVGDIRNLSMKSADEIIDYWKKGFGAFTSDDWIDADSDLIREEEDDCVAKNITRFTSDKEYAIVDNSWDNVQDDYKDSEDGDDSNCFIDIYKFVRIEEYNEEDNDICIPCDSCGALNWIKNDLRIFKCEYCGKYFVNCSACKNKELNYSCENCPLKILAMVKNNKIEENEK